MANVPSMMRCFCIVGDGQFQFNQSEDRYRLELEWGRAWQSTIWKKGGAIEVSPSHYPSLPVEEMLSNDSDLLVAELEYLGIDPASRLECLKVAQQCDIRIFIATNKGALLYPVALDEQLLDDLEHDRPQKSPGIDETVAHLRRVTDQSITFKGASSGHFEFTFKGRGFLWWEKTHTFCLTETVDGWSFHHNGQPQWHCASGYGRLLEPLRKKYCRLTGQD